jgi:hypothetical protein
MFRLAVESTQPHIQWYQRFLLGETGWGRDQLEHDVDHFSASNDKIKNEWNQTSAVLACLHGVDYNSFTFTASVVALLKGSGHCIIPLVCARFSGGSVFVSLYNYILLQYSVL